MNLGKPKSRKMFTINKVNRKNGTLDKAASVVCDENKSMWSAFGSWLISNHFLQHCILIRLAQTYVMMSLVMLKKKNLNLSGTKNICENAERAVNVCYGRQLILSLHSPTWTQCWNFPQGLIS